MCEYPVDTPTSWPDVVSMSRKETNKALGVAFGSVVKSIRERAGFSQEGFAHEAGFDRSFWGAIERGRYNPSLGTIWRVAEALGKRPKDLMAAVEKAMAADQEPEAEKGAQESTVSSAAKKTPRHLGYAGQSRDVAESTEDG